jgi:hypothetical protein
MKPPRLAEWLLTHLAPGPMTEALAGDLAEEFTRRQSPAWYWRQVAISIAAVIGRYLPILALWTAIAYRFMPRMWRWLIPSDRRTWYWHMSRPARAASFLGISIATDTVVILAGVALALALVCELRARALLSGLLPALLLSTAGAIDIALRAPSSFRRAYSSVICLGLLFALRSARTSLPRQRRESA